MAKKKTDTADYVEKAIKEVEVWEKRKPSFLANVGDFILKPLEVPLGKIIPEKVQNSVAKALEGSLLGLDKVLSLVVNRGKIIAEYKKRSKGKRSIDGKLKIADDMAMEAWRWHVGYAVTQGAAYGVLGLPGLAANIPTLFSVAIRGINEIAFAYGYGENSPLEKEYMLKILQNGSAGDVKAKLEGLIALKQMEQVLIKVSWKKMSIELAAKQLGIGAALAGVRQFAKSLGVQITKRKALQSIPVIGALIGGSFDGIYVNDICETAYMSYRRRFIEQWQAQKVK